MPIIVSIAYLFSNGADINWYLAVWTLVGMVLFHVTGNLWSDYFDFKKKVDDTDTFGATSITSGQFQASEIRNFAIGMLVVSVLSGLGILYCTGLPILWIGLAGAVCMLLYPFLKYNALVPSDLEEVVIRLKLDCQPSLATASASLKFSKPCNAVYSPSTDW